MRGPRSRYMAIITNNGQERLLRAQGQRPGDSVGTGVQRTSLVCPYAASGPRDSGHASALGMDASGSASDAARAALRRPVSAVA